MEFNELLVELLDDSDDDDDDDYREGEDDEVRIEINVENWKRLGDPQFQKHFRMERYIFERLLVAVGVHLVQCGRLVRRSKRGLDLSLMMVLWILATQDTFRAVGVKFGALEGTVHFHYKYIIQALRELRTRYIQWPSAYEKELISTIFEELYGYPSVCGCIDGYLICITAPLEQPQEYVDRHHQHSIHLQAVCDHNLLFRDVYVGQPGSVGDKRAFMRSPLGQSILVEPNLVGDKHLLGDGGYTLTSKLLIPYRNLGHLTERERCHNYILSRCRSTIERAFALLKGKWRRLKLFQHYCLEYALDHIMSCLVLHNFIILEGVAYEVNECRVVPRNADVGDLYRQAKADGVVRRDFIADMLHHDHEP